MITYYVYILTNKKNRVMYSGFTNNVIRTVYEHRNGLLNGFTKKHAVNKLVYLEKFNNIEQAVNRDNVIKEMTKEDKIGLIEYINPQWKDMYYDIGGDDEYEFYDNILEKHKKEFTSP